MQCVCTEVFVLQRKPRLVEGRVELVGGTSAGEALSVASVVVSERGRRVVDPLRRWGGLLVQTACVRDLDKALPARHPATGAGCSSTLCGSEVAAVCVRSAVIVDAVRSPMAVEGVFSGLSGVGLLAQVLSGLIDRADVDPEMVNDVVVGQQGRDGEALVSLGRRAWLAAGLRGEAASTVLERGADVGCQAVHVAVQRVLAGECGVVVAGGVEWGSRTGADGHSGGVADWVAAEMMCARWKFTREQLDEYALRSHRRAAEVAAAGEFRGEIVPVRVWTPQLRRVVCEDTTFRSELTAEVLASLPTLGERTGWAERFPELQKCVTAGNSALSADGASAVLISDERRARDLGLRARARLHSVAVAVSGDDPVAMFNTRISAAVAALERFGLRPQQIDHFEVCETYAAVPLAWQAAFDVNPDLLNPRGGAIALGYPPGASCARMLTTMLGALEATGGRYGLQLMGVAEGLATLFIVERL
jgi:acetyl-CoA acyltransferase